MLKKDVKEVMLQLKYGVKTPRNNSHNSHAQKGSVHVMSKEVKIIMNPDYKYNKHQKQQKRPDNPKYNFWDLLTDLKFYLALIVVIIVILKWSGLIFNH